MKKKDGVLKKLFFNQKGSILPFVIFLAALVASLSVFILERNSIHSKTSIHELATADTNAAMTRIAALFLSPANCNANFWVSGTAYYAASGTFGDVKLCAFGQHCTPGTASSGDITQFATVLAPTSELWDASVTGFTRRVRIVDMFYQISHTQGGGYNDPSIATVYVTFQKNLGTSIVNGSKVIKTATIQRAFDFPVVLDSTKTLIMGCPKTPNSLIIY